MSRTSTETICLSPNFLYVYILILAICAESPVKHEPTNQIQKDVQY